MLLEGLRKITYNVVHVNEYTRCDSSLVTILTIASQRSALCLRLQVIMAVRMSMVVLRIVTPCCLADDYRRFGGNVQYDDD
jgi:hypothetical protein